VLGWETCQPVVVLLGKDMVLTHPIIQLGMTCVFFSLACWYLPSQTLRNTSSFTEFLPCSKTSPAPILAAITPSSDLATKHNITTLIIVLCLLTQNLIQHISFTPNITQSSMVCCSLPFRRRLFAYCVYSFALWQEWKFSAWAYSTTTPWRTWCNGRQCVPPIWRPTCIRLGILPLRRTSVIRARNQQGLRPLASHKFKGWQWCTTTLVFSRRNVSNNRCNSRGRHTIWDNPLQICRSDSSQPTSMDDRNLRTLYAKLSNPLAPSTCHKRLRKYLHSQTLLSIQSHQWLCVV